MGLKLQSQAKLTFGGWHFSAIEQVHEMLLFYLKDLEWPLFCFNLARAVSSTAHNVTHPFAVCDNTQFPGDVEVLFCYSLGSYDRNHRQRPA